VLEEYYDPDERFSLYTVHYVMKASVDLIFGSETPAFAVRTPLKGGLYI
jgi:hypothetical protein